MGTKLRNLETHKLSHHDGVRYNCNQCSYKSTQKSSLNAHKRVVHEGIHHECDKCSYTGISPYPLKSANIRKMKESNINVTIVHLKHLAKVT